MSYKTLYCLKKGLIITIKENNFIIKMIGPMTNDNTRSDILKVKSFGSQYDND